MAGKHIGPATLGTSDPYSGARKINSMSRDAVPALPLGDIGFGTPDMENGGKYATGDIPPPEPSGGQGLASGAAQSQHPDERVGMMKTTAGDGQPRHPQAVRPLSNDELMAQAQAMLDAQRAAPQGSSLSPRDASGSQITDTNGQKLPDWLVREQEGGGG